MCSLQHVQRSCACTRYLSPTRLGHEVQKLTGSVPLQQQCRANSAKIPPTAISKSLDTFQTIKTSVKSGWSKISLKKPIVAVDSVARTITALNIDLPKSLLDYTSYLPGVTKLKLTKGTLTENDTKKNGAGEGSSMQCERKKIVQSQEDSQIEREQHDLETAVTCTDYSVPTFYSTAEVSCTEEPQVEKLPQKPKEMSITSALGNLVKVGQSEKDSDEEKRDSRVQEKIKTFSVKNDIIVKGVVDKRMRGLVHAVQKATSQTSRRVRVEELCKYLLQHPEARAVAVKEKILPCLLQMRNMPNELLHEQVLEALALLGYVDPVKGRGIRILTIDGGGVRGLIAIETLKKLEQSCNVPLHSMFDYVCGVSTGALIATLLVVFKLPLDICEQIYKDFSAELFRRNRLMGAGKLFMSHAFYDTELWEKSLQDNMNDKSYLETARDPTCPKLSAVSTIMNGPCLRNFLFRNYNLALGVQSHYPGSCRYKLWEGIRASSAAPGYYQEFKLDDFVHQDGGLLTNNPTAIALHECRLLWPGSDVQCVLSLGTGRYQPPQDTTQAEYSTLKTKLAKIVQSATDTEAVHTVLQDLLPPNSYFRFNPYMSEDFLLDEVREDKWDLMKHDTNMYFRKNEFKFQRAAQKLVLPKLSHQKAADWLKLKTDAMAYR